MTRLLLDFGLFVLIWLVQLVVYPSFIHFSKKGLETWHQKYTPRISFLVVPLMLGQLMAYGALLQEIKNFYSIDCFVLVLLVWLVTFTFFVPRHKAISAGKYSEKNLEELVKWNWIRTAVWSILFLWNYTIFY